MVDGVEDWPGPRVASCCGSAAARRRGAIGRRVRRRASSRRPSLAWGCWPTRGDDGDAAAARRPLRRRPVGSRRSSGRTACSASRRRSRRPGGRPRYALLLWQALGSHEGHRRRAVAWILAQEGRRIPKSDDPDHIVGHDTTLAGWPWVAGTHSWLEPTVLALLALRRAGRAADPRVVEGYRLVRDRAIETGGWNYGNKSAFGHALRPQPAPTGLALLALAHRDGRTEIVARAIRYLHETLPGVRASASLGWGLLGLRAWQRTPEAAPAWLAEAYHRATGRPDAAPEAGDALLLAAGDHARNIVIILRLT